MKLYLHEITDQDTELTFDQSAPWLVQIIESLDEVEAPQRPGKPAKSGQSPRPIHAELHFRKVDDVVVASGRLDAQAYLLCSRCTTPFTLPIKNQFSALFCKDPVMAGVDRNHGKARHAHAAPHAGAAGEGGWSESDQDLDITYLSHDFIDLSDVLTEQLTLQMPFQPLCKEDCKGICANCGADLNRGRCACAKVNSQSPFSVLQDLKLPKQSESKE